MQTPQLILYKQCSGERRHGRCWYHLSSWESQSRPWPYDKFCILSIKSLKLKTMRMPNLPKDRARDGDSRRMKEALQTDDHALTVAQSVRPFTVARRHEVTSSRSRSAE
eukprot:32192_1